MATKAEKTQKLEAVKKLIAKAKVAIVTDYNGLSVAEITDLRRQLQKDGADYTVVKNTLAKLAVKHTEFEGISEFLSGPSALALGFEDQVSAAKVLKKFVKENNKVEIKGGVLDGKVLTVDDINGLANLPSREELYVKMLGSINAPASGIVNIATGVMRALVCATDAVRKQKESA